MTTISALFVLGLVAADPAPDVGKLLTTFRDEFVQVTPGKKRLPGRVHDGK